MIGDAGGYDVIADFEDGLDRIDIGAFSLGSVADFASVKNDAGGVRIDIDGGGADLFIDGLSTMTLDDSDFVF